MRTAAAVVEHALVVELGAEVVGLSLARESEDVDNLDTVRADLLAHNRIVNLE